MDLQIEGLNFVSYITSYFFAWPVECWIHRTVSLKM